MQQLVGNWQSENKRNQVLVLHPLLPQSISPFWLRLNVGVLGNGNRSSSTALPPFLLKFLILCEGTFTLVHKFTANISLRDPLKPCQDSAIRFSDGWTSLLGTFQSENNLQIPLDPFHCCCLLLGTWFSVGFSVLG